MNKIIEIVNRNILINVNNISYITIIDNKIIFYINNRFTIPITSNNLNKLYNNIKTFILDNQATLMQIE